MSLASLLKKGSLRGFANANLAKVAKHDLYSPPTLATLATLALANAPDRAANDPKQSPANDGGTIRPAGLSAKLLAASLALDAQIQAIGDLTGDLEVEPLVPPQDFTHGIDPTPTATTGRETDTHAARVIRFTGKGVTPTDGEALADKLATRDRDSDDRRLCLECSHLAGHAGSWRCRGWQRAGIALQARDSGLPGDLVHTLQRCDGFTATH